MGTEHATRPAFLPGQPLPVPSDTNASVGDGVYAKDGVFRASRMGHFESDGNATLLSVRGERPPLVIPRPESTIFGRVTRVMPRQATVSILVVDGLPCGGALNAAGASTNRAAGEGIDGADFQGILRQQDVRSTEKDSVVLSQCFRPGDILRAVVISLGDARSYYLSTAGNHLGVVHAVSSDPDMCGSLGWAPSARAMQPISWKEMADPVTGMVEPRKCAKPDWL